MKSSRQRIALFAIIIKAALLVAEFAYGGEFDMGGQEVSGLPLAGRSRSSVDEFMMSPVIGDAEERLPEVFAYSQPGCPPCIRAKKELADATDLPFRVVWQEGAGPEWLESRPGFWWHVTKDQPSQEDVQSTRQFVGWQGLKDFTERWKKSREQKAAESKATAGYPIRKSWWSHPGERLNRADLIHHLQTGLHAGKFSRKYLESLSPAELESLHSDDHEGRVRSPVFTTKRLAQHDCPTGVCPPRKIIWYSLF